MLVKDFKAEINKTNNHLDFWEFIQSHGELVFEEFVTYYLKATLPGDTYWLGEDVVPPHVAEQYKISKLLKGKRSMGGDVLNVYQGRAVAYEVKWLWKKESIDFKRISIKLQALQITDVDQLIVATNARKSSQYFIDFAEDVGFMYHESWITKEVFDTVKNYVNSQSKKAFNPMTPRVDKENFFVNALNTLKNDFDNKFSNISRAKILTKIFMQWPAASGKGSFPRLAYDLIFEPRWSYTKSYPINTVVNPTLTVLKGNLVKQIQHDIGLGNDAIHVIYAGDVTKAAKDTEELQTIRTLAKVFADRKEFLEWIGQDHNQTVWIHTTVHSFERLAKMMKAVKKYFFFAHIDEVHHMVQPDYSTWTAPLKDSDVKVQIRLMTSANKRIIKGSGAKFSMDDPNFCDLAVVPLSESKAVELGFKRKTELINYVYSTDDFKQDWIELLDDGKQGLFKLKGTDLVVPMSWFMAAEGLLRFRTEFFTVQHTKLTLNTIKECQDFAKFLNIVKKPILSKVGDMSDPVVKRLLKSHIMVADTENNSTVKLLKEVSAVPDTHNDSFIIHCRLLGEGWDPENGWVDSNMFISPTHSEIRIYQDVNRGSRIGDGSKKINYVVLFHIDSADDDNAFNNMFKNIKKVGSALEIGADDISETVQFRTYRKLTKAGGLNTTGSEDPDYHDEMDADFFCDSFDKYMRNGRYYEFGDTINEIGRRFWNLVDEYGYYQLGHETGHKLSDIAKMVIVENKDFFDMYAVSGRTSKMEQIYQGKDFRQGEDAILEILQFQKQATKKSLTRFLEIRKYLEDGGKSLNDFVKKQHNVKEHDYEMLKGEEVYLGSSVYKFGDDDFDESKVNLNPSHFLDVNDWTPNFWYLDHFFSSPENTSELALIQDFQSSLSEEEIWELDVLYDDKEYHKPAKGVFGKILELLKG